VVLAVVFALLCFACFAHRSSWSSGRCGCVFLWLACNAAQRNCVTKNDWIRSCDVQWGAYWSENALGRW